MTGKAFLTLNIFKPDRTYAELTSETVHSVPKMLMKKAPKL